LALVSSTEKRVLIALGLHDRDRQPSLLRPEVAAHHYYTDNNQQYLAVRPSEYRCHANTGVPFAR